MIRKLLTICVIVFPSLALAQAGEWTWMSGVNTTGFSGAFGTQGVPNVNNSPPSLYEACEWKDHQGNFWLYGGTLNYYGDMWRYNPVTNEWTWMTGTGLANPGANHGIQGVASAANAPGVRGYGVMTWTDNNNNLWLFGGYNTGYFNDLWKYDIASNLWTWMSGDTTINSLGNFGTQGVPSALNKPPAMCEDACTWIDKSNNLWLYGGYYNSQGYGDVWKYDIAADEWTWMKGTSVIAAPAIYGTLRVPASSNAPGGRWEYTHWTNDSIQFWTFGGELNGGACNDMWMFNTLTNNWTWMSGPSTVNDPGNFGIRCSTDVLNAPESRYENRSSVTDNCGKFWFYGGYFGFHDLWKYDPLIYQWTYIGPSSASATAVYGTRGISNAANTPGSRSGAVAWMDAQNNYWIYGGYDIGATYGDLWRFTPDSTCGGSICSLQPPVANFQSSDTTFCTETGECIDFFDLSTGNPTSWHWSFPGAVPDTSSLQNPTNICYFNQGSYAVTLIISNGIGSDTLDVLPHIIFSSPPSNPTVTIYGGDTLVSSHASGYQWYLNGFPIAAATDSFYVAHQGGTYSVRITDQLGCSSISNGVLITGTNELVSGRDVEVFPNPFGEQLTIVVKGHDEIEFVLLDITSRKLLEQRIRNSVSLSTDWLAKGVYLYELKNRNGLIRNGKLIKQ